MLLQEHWLKPRQNLNRLSFPSYLEIAEFIKFSGARPREDLRQLWRRIVFSMAISNTDDHLRNHGFLLGQDGWSLSPGYEINPSVEKSGLSLNVDAEQNFLELELCREIAPLFGLDNIETEKIITQVLGSTKNWQTLALKIGIPRTEQDLMSPAFRFL